MKKKKSNIKLQNCIENSKARKSQKKKNLPCGRTFQAIVSVTAVKIQLSSPKSVLRSFGRPGILSMSELSRDSRSNERLQNLISNKKYMSN